MYNIKLLKIYFSYIYITANEGCFEIYLIIHI
jgi:hypothetical protein